MNKRLIVPLLALFVGLVLGELLGGPYEFVKTAGSAVWRVNRITGTTAICYPSTYRVPCYGQGGILPPVLGGE